MVPTEKLDPLPISKSWPVQMKDREGVFAHAFKCFHCGLEWVLFSWLANRHHVGEVSCPECRERGLMMHRRACLNERTEFDDSDTEIFSIIDALPGLVPMDDSEFPP
jgi:hypothetical protein